MSQIVYLCIIILFSDQKTGNFLLNFIEYFFEILQKMNQDVYNNSETLFSWQHCF